jgi:hypothetical protein
MGLEIQEVFSYVDIFKQGTPPITGGSLDQSKWFLSVANFVWSDDNKVERESMK